ncbi:hypothetical protein CEQ90_05945 [Lewinellaceae bacterium SD302]|nr:hypothetical protein CEQ90_05945 [Lewinellaceae bacterium SD302]
MRVFFYPILLLFCFACTQDKESATSEPANESISLNEDLLGTWEIVEMRVKAPSYMGSDSTFIQHITEADWGQVYGVKPAKTAFTKDGKFKRTLFLRTGQTTDVVNGLWKIEGDSLLTIEPNVTLSYLPTLDGEKLKLVGTIDYDRDGVSDDEYEANYRLVARTQ